MYEKKCKYLQVFVDPNAGAPSMNREKWETGNIKYLLFDYSASLNIHSQLSGMTDCQVVCPYNSRVTPTSK
jgi:epoxyqueuosine reductase QueG